MSLSALFHGDAFQGLPHQNAHEVLDAQCTCVIALIEASGYDDIRAWTGFMQRVRAECFHEGRWFQLRRMLVMRLDEAHWTSLVGTDHNGLVFLKFATQICEDYDARRALFARPFLVELVVRAWMRYADQMVSVTVLNALLFALFEHTPVHTLDELTRMPEAADFLNKLCEHRCCVIVHCGVTKASSFAALVNSSLRLDRVRTSVADMCDELALISLDNVGRSDLENSLLGALLLVSQRCEKDDLLAQSMADVRFAASCRYLQGCTEHQWLCRHAADLVSYMEIYESCRSESRSCRREKGSKRCKGAWKKVLAANTQHVVESLHRFCKDSAGSGGAGVSRACCSWCGARSAAALQECASCKLARYCCKQCQKSHWKCHKELCRTYLERLNPSCV